MVEQVSTRETIGNIVAAQIEHSFFTFNTLPLSNSTPHACSSLSLRNQW